MINNKSSFFILSLFLSLIFITESCTDIEVDEPTRLYVIVKKANTNTPTPVKANVLMYSNAEHFRLDTQRKTFNRFTLSTTTDDKGILYLADKDTTLLKAKVVLGDSLYHFYITYRDTVSGEIYTNLTTTTALTEKLHLKKMTIFKTELK